MTKQYKQEKLKSCRDLYKQRFCKRCEKPMEKDDFLAKYK